MIEIPAEYDTVFVGTIEGAGMGGAGGFHRRWYVKIRVGEQLRGTPLPHPGVILYIHSPVQEFPELIGDASPGDADYTAPLVGTSWTWALRTEGTTIESFRRFPAPE